MTFIFCTHRHCDECPSISTIALKNWLTERIRTEDTSLLAHIVSIEAISPLMCQIHDDSFLIITNIVAVS
jgi:hypothetical protein